MSSAFLKTEHLDLRPLQTTDADGPYLAWFNDPDVCRYNSHFVLPYKRSDALAYIERANSTPSELILAIVERSTGQHIGNIALTNIDFISRTAEFAIVMGDRSTWGKGYSKEAAKALVGHGFGALNLNRI
jgi:[ribosomal protein S5]-alanine N-acetyltransferase